MKLQLTEKTLIVLVRVMTELVVKLVVNGCEVSGNGSVQTRDTSVENSFLVATFL